MQKILPILILFLLQVPQPFAICETERHVIGDFDACFIEGAEHIGIYHYFFTEEEYPHPTIIKWVAYGEYVPTEIFVESEEENKGFDITGYPFRGTIEFEHGAERITWIGVKANKVYLPVMN